MNRVWIAEKHFNANGNGRELIAVCATAEGASQQARSVLESVYPGQYGEWNPSHPYEEGETDFLAREGYVTLATVRAYRILD